MSWSTSGHLPGVLPFDDGYGGGQEDELLGIGQGIAESLVDRPYLAIYPNFLSKIRAALGERRQRRVKQCTDSTEQYIAEYTASANSETTTVRNAFGQTQLFIPRTASFYLDSDAPKCSEAVVQKYLSAVVCLLPDDRLNRTGSGFCVFDWIPISHRFGMVMPALTIQFNNMQRLAYAKRTKLDLPSSLDVTPLQTHTPDSFYLYSHTECIHVLTHQALNLVHFNLPGLPSFSAVASIYP